MLWVYEIEGGKYPGDAPASGLEGIWPEGRYYYLFYSRDAAGLIRPWIENHPDRRLASQYNLPLEKWQDVPGSQIAIGPFSIEPFKHGSPPAPARESCRLRAPSSALRRYGPWTAIRRRYKMRPKISRQTASLTA